MQLLPGDPSGAYHRPDRARSFGKQDLKISYCKPNRLSRTEFKCARMAC